MNCSAMTLNLVPFNCQGIKSSIPEIHELCDKHDICLIQESWLMENELCMLHNIHKDFAAFVISSIDVSKGIIGGRSYGGLAFLWRKALSQHISIKKFDDKRIIVIEINTLTSKLLLLNVYLPYESHDNYDEYIHCLGKICTILDDADTANVIVMDDWNANPNSGSLFGSELKLFCDDNALIASDSIFLADNLDVHTYVSLAHYTTSWLDHCITTSSAHHCVQDVSVSYDYVSSDHFPLSAKISVDLLVQGVATENVAFRYNWSSMNDTDFCVTMSLLLITI